MGSGGSSRSVDVSVTSNPIGAIVSAAYTKPIPISTGTRRILGQVIWATPIEQRVTTTTTSSRGGKGGGGGTSSVEEQIDYFVSMAISFGEPLIPTTGDNQQRILRIWADRSLVYDARANGNVDALPNLRFRLYYADPAQVADPLIEDNVGAANAPAFRHLIYMVCEEWNLLPWGNRVPVLEVEMVEDTTITNPEDVYAEILPANGLADSHNDESLSPDWPRRRLFVTDTTPITGTGFILREWSLITKEEVGQLRVDPTLVSSGSVAVAAQPPRIISPLNIAFHHFDSPAAWVTYDVTTGVLLGEYSGANGDDMTGVSAYSGMDWQLVYTLDGFRIFVQTAGVTSNSALYEVAVDTGLISLIDNNPGFSFAWPKAGWVDAGISCFYGITAVRYISMVTIDLNGNAFWYENVIDLGADGAVRHIYFDYSTNAIIVMWGGAGSIDYVSKYDSTDYSLIWTSAGISGGGRGVNLQNDNQRFSRIANDRLGWGSGPAHNAFYIDLRTGVITEATNWSPSTGLPEGQLYDGTNNSLIWSRTGLGEDDLTQAYLDRGDGSRMLLSVFLDFMARKAGYASGDISIDATIDDTITGAILQYLQPKSFRAIIDPVATAYGIKVIERDGKIIFRKPATGASLVIDHSVAEADLKTLASAEFPSAKGSAGSGAKLVTTFKSESLQYERFDLTYLDETFDYNPVLYSAKRHSNTVVSTHNAKGALKVEIPIIMQADEAATLSSRALYREWTSGVQQDFALGPKYYDIEPADIVAFTIGNFSYTAQVSELRRSKDWGIKVKAENFLVNDVIDVTAQTPTADTQIVSGPNDSDGYILNLPLLDPTHDTNALSLRGYGTIGGIGQTGWSGGALFTSKDRFTWTKRASSVVEGQFGKVLNVLPDNNAPDATDVINPLDVFLTNLDSDDLVSVTELELAEGANRAIIGTAGRWEIIGFQTVTKTSDREVRLTNILRGLRGSNINMGSHALNDFFIVLDANRTKGILWATSDINSTIYYKAVGQGEFAQLKLPQVVVPDGSGEKPLPVKDHEAVIDGSNHLDLAWIRQSRTFIGMVDDGTENVPLGEATEEYEIDIYDTLGGSIVRSVTGLSTPVYQYTSANQTTDGFSPPMTKLVVKIFQISALVDRGFSEEVEIDVT